MLTIIPTALWRPTAILHMQKCIVSMVTISEEAKFLRVLMATFSDNKQALYAISQYVLQLPIHHITAN